MLSYITNFNGQFNSLVVSDRTGNGFYRYGNGTHGITRYDTSYNNNNTYTTYLGIPIEAQNILPSSLTINIYGYSAARCLIYILTEQGTEEYFIVCSSGGNNPMNWAGKIYNLKSLQQFTASSSVAGLLSAYPNSSFLIAEIETSNNRWILDSSHDSGYAGVTPQTGGIYISASTTELTLTRNDSASISSTAGVRGIGANYDLTFSISNISSRAISVPDLSEKVYKNKVDIDNMEDDIEDLSETVATAVSDVEEAVEQVENVIGDLSNYYISR